MLIRLFASSEYDVRALIFCLISLYVPNLFPDAGLKLMNHAPVTAPFLLRFATPRSADTVMPGRYASELGVWVVEDDEGERPIIENACHSLIATQTKTMQHVEADDDDATRFGSIETGTFTEVRQEADDEDASLCLPELTTKTDVVQEQDDEVVMPGC